MARAQQLQTYLISNADPYLQRILVRRLEELCQKWLTVLDIPIPTPPEGLEKTPVMTLCCDYAEAGVIGAGTIMDKMRAHLKNIENLRNRVVHLAEANKRMMDVLEAKIDECRQHEALEVVMGRRSGMVKAVMMHHQELIALQAQGVQGVTGLLDHIKSIVQNYFSADEQRKAMEAESLSF